MSNPFIESRASMTVCRGFVWIGQSWERCDRCGEPAKAHKGIEEPCRDHGPFCQNHMQVTTWEQLRSRVGRASR